MFNRNITAVALVLTILGLDLAPGFITHAHKGNHLSAPEGVACTFDGTTLATSWDEVTTFENGDEAEAAKYSVSLEAGYDTTGDGEADTFVEYDFGTSDRTDGEPISATFLDIPFEALSADLTDDGADNPIAPLSVEARVKALKAPGQGGNDNPFSDPAVDCGV